MKKITSVIMTGALLGLSATVLAEDPDGQKIYQASCQACHATGAANAPKLGDKEVWAPRIATGIDALLAVAIKGKGAMPPKGACASCSDADLKAAIEYMVSQSQ
jgi:cytochrome c5